MVLLAWAKAGRGVAVFTLLGFVAYFMVWDSGKPLCRHWHWFCHPPAWPLSSGVPIGVWTANSNRAEKVIHPILDLMQTMPAFVYLIPAVLFFGLGVVPGVFATIIFAMPPVIRLTRLGIRQVPKNV